MIESFQDPIYDLRISQIVSMNLTRQFLHLSYLISKLKANTVPKMKYSVIVIKCDFDCEDENFCTNSCLKIYAIVVKSYR